MKKVLNNVSAAEFEAIKKEILTRFEGVTIDGNNLLSIPTTEHNRMAVKEWKKEVKAAILFCQNLISSVETSLTKDKGVITYIN